MEAASTMTGTSYGLGDLADLGQGHFTRLLVKGAQRVGDASWRCAR